MAVALGLIPAVEDGRSVSAATERLIDRLLVLREVQRYAPPEPPDAQIDARLASVRRDSRHGAPDAALEAGGFTESSVRAWIRDDLRIASYLGQRFAAAWFPATMKCPRISPLTARSSTGPRPASKPRAPVIRERLSRERRTELINDWIADLRRRTTVVDSGKAG